MARNKSGASGQQAQSAEIIDLSYGTSLFATLHVGRLKGFFSHIAPELAPTTIGLNRIKMRCPEPGHLDRTPSFFIDVAQGFAWCAACHYHTRNLLELMRDCFSYTYSETIQRINEICSFRVATDKIQKRLDEVDQHQQAIRYITEACNLYLQTLVGVTMQGQDIPEGEDGAYYTPASIQSAKAPLDWLFRTRGLDPELVPYLPYGMFPPVALAKTLTKRLLDEDFARLYKNQVDVQKDTRARRERITECAMTMLNMIAPEYVHSAAFFMGYTTNTPATLRLRRMSVDTQKEGYFWNSPGAGDKSPLGFFGLYSPTLVRHTSRREVTRLKTLVVEGEFDALKILENIVRDCIPDIQVIATAGSNNELETLKNSGHDLVYLLGDHPDPQYGRGDEWLKYCLGSAFDVRCRVFNAWDQLRGFDLAIKDPDDAIRTRGWEHFQKTVIDQESNFVTADVWAANKAIEECASIDKDDVIAKTAHAAIYGQCVRAPMLLASFVTRVSSALDLAPAPLRQEIVKAKDTEAGFIARVVETLRFEFQPLYRKDNSHGGSIILFHRLKRRQLEVPVGDGNAIMIALSNIFGNMYEYFRDTIGLPKYDANVPDNSPVMRDGQKFVADYLKIAMQELYKDVLSEDECVPLGPGIHFDWNADEKKHVARIHNGNKWFKLVCDEDLERVEVQELKGPVDENYLFKISSRHGTWSKDLLTESDILESNNITVEQLRQAFEDLKHMYSTYWAFKYPTEDSMFLSAFQFVVAAGDAFIMKNIVRLMGESNSGKSMCLATFAGGQAPTLKLNSQVGYSSDFSPSGLIRDWEFSTLAMCLDEFSQTDNANSTKSKHIENIQNDIFRQIGYEGGAVKHRVDHKGTPSRVRTHVILTTVHEPRDAQDENRSYTITTVKSDSIRDPQVGIMKEWTAEKLANIRRTIQLGLLRFLPKLRRQQDEIYAFLNREQLTSYECNSRFLRNFATVGSVLQLLQYDWKAIVKDMAESRKERLTIQKQNTHVTLLFERMLRTPIVPLPGGSAKTSIQALFVDNDGPLLLNAAGVGATLYKERYILCVDLIAATAPGGVLGRVDDVLGKMTPSQFRTIYEQHPLYIPPSKFEELELPGFMARVGINVGSLTIAFDVAALREQMLALKGTDTEDKGTDKTNNVIPLKKSGNEI